MADTSIEWADAVWNPSTGCDMTSRGCDNCYALKMAGRLKAMGQAKYQTDGDPRTSGPGFGLAVHEDALTIPLRWRKPRRIFINSMSDLFHDKVPAEFVAKVFAVMAATPHHTYQLLTKRHARMRSLLSRGELGTEGFPDTVEEATAEFTHASLDEWPLRNVWLGVSVEDQQWADIRIPALLDTPAAVRWISAEPLLGPVKLADAWLRTNHASLASSPTVRSRTRLSWVVVGGESGPGARPMELDWARTLVRQCQGAGVPVFCKQLGIRWGKEHHNIDLFPQDLRVRQYPEPVAAGGVR